MLPFSTTSIDLKGIMLTEISQIKANIEGYNLDVKSKKLKKMNITKEKQTHMYREQSNCQWEEGSEKGQREREQIKKCKLQFIK